ncbi:PREDICTED: uncharacterized protein LOC106806152 [Priapulus caudatus]|uniref:Uncharacterized protein LOC106806152 n=1 Tax=Priapulus caudatus TaxID=37621 RepID=A0ABM1DU80_PRICU|nr:PREDICTED: uncharacterized protein LOC106806152 [Priapulus caudatus]
MSGFDAARSNIKEERHEERGTAERHGHGAEETPKDLRHSVLAEKDSRRHNVPASNGHHVINGLASLMNGKEDSDDSDEERDTDLSEAADVTSSGNAAEDKHHASLAYVSGPETHGISSTETLLMNIQGLLKVAADNARQQERQVNYERAELKMELLRERELRDNLEKQLVEEQKMRIIFQKRLKKEKKARKKLHDDMHREQKRRQQLEEALSQACPPDALRMLNESLSKDVDMERTSRNENERKLPTTDFMQEYTTRAMSCIVPSYQDSKMAHSMAHVPPVQSVIP